ncbi:MAG: transcription elongation factor GreA [Rickettsiales bacterium]|jgi:transcription elongation factor GreA|nr:transcription elongation factor GreA [Rickettsiales bacterium]
MDKQPISIAGFRKLQGRLRQLKEVERPQVLDAVRRARDLGDLSENADYKTAREAQRNIDGEIRRLEAIAGNASIINVAALSGDRVMFGATVFVEDDDGRKVKYKILSEYEANLSENIIAITSPLARGLVGRRVGDTCVIRTPSGEKEYEITDVKYGD